jgi:hypothetical protein
MAKKSIIRKIIGEAADVPAPEAVAQDVASAQTPEKTTLTPGQSIPVETLLATWEKGDKSAVAVRVLDALDSYQQFVDLCFRIGREGALELGGIMDELTSEEKSPHEYDVLPDADLATKFSAGHGPRPGPATHAATGESIARRMMGEKA